MKTQTDHPKSKNSLPDFDSKKLGDTIRLLREKNRLTQSELGKLSGYSTAELCKIENGLRKKIPMDALITIAPHLNVSIDYILTTCVSNYQSDYEKFYDLDKKEIDMLNVARRLYMTDSKLFFLLSSKEFLSNKEAINLTKQIIEFQTNVIPKKEFGFKKLAENFLQYCTNFITCCTEETSIAGTYCDNK